MSKNLTNRGAGRVYQMRKAKQELAAKKAINAKRKPPQKPPSQSASAHRLSKALAQKPPKK